MKDDRLDRICQMVRTLKESPTMSVGAGGYIFLPDRDGNVVVFKHGTELKVLAINQLNDGFSASPAIVGDQIYLRGHRYLYCIANMNN